MDKLVYFMVCESDAFFLRQRYLYLIEELLLSFKVKLLMGENPAVREALEKSGVLKQGNFSIFEAKKLVKKIPGKEKNKYFSLVKDLLQMKIPTIGIELWKVLLLDDLNAHVRRDFYEPPPMDVDNPDFILAPLYESTRTSTPLDYYYPFQLYKLAKEKGIPFIGVELQKLSSKFYYHYHFYDYFVLKSDESKELLKEKLKIPEERIFLLKDKYKFILKDTDVSPFDIIKVFQFLESLAGEIFSGKPVVTVVHNTFNRYAFRKALRILSRIKEELTILAVTHPDTIVISLKEKEIVEQAYTDEIRKLPHRIFVLNISNSTPEYLSLFSDVVIYTEPSEISNYTTLPENVLLFDQISFFDENKFMKHLSTYLKSQEKKYTLSSVLKALAGDK